MELAHLAALENPVLLLQKQGLDEEVEQLKQLASDNADTLLVVIVDECHYAPTRGGAYDQLVNDRCERCARMAPGTLSHCTTATSTRG